MWKILPTILGLLILITAWESAAEDIVHLPLRLVEIRGDEARVGSTLDLRFSPDSSKLLLSNGDSDGRAVVRLWDVETDRLVHRFDGHTERVLSVRFSSDGRRIVTSSWDGTARIWDAVTGENIYTYVDPSTGLSTAELSPDGSMLLIGHGKQTDPERGEVLIDLVSGEELATFRSYSWGIVRAGAFSPDGSLIFIGNWTHDSELWDGRTFEFVRRIETESNAGITMGEFSPNGKWIVTTNRYAVGIDPVEAIIGQIDVWDVETGELARAFPGHSAEVWATFSPDSRYIASASDDRSVKLWNLQTGESLTLMMNESRQLRSLDFSPDGRHLAVGDTQRTVYLWDVSSLISSSVETWNAYR